MKIQISNTILTPQERYFIWHDYKERMYDFWSDVENALNAKFQRTTYSPEVVLINDEDASNMEKLFHMLLKVDEFICEHDKELEKVYFEWEG